ncbi:MNIO family bufferin maturase [Piscinibacter sakaiensis]|uniref:Uncharacterized protein n=1 Tax=Piscinibacter sakaiensis TaxID=1547922 RepID=A0A0K8P253_PISS1|nr:DUF692 domain-containing protein [Piscinibacter sakaiensis]GAP36683.1 hypothetical protein ISF6_2523 [Piscinibacter sakaiensis]
MPPFPRCETLPPAGPAGGPVAAGPLLAGIGLKAAHADTALATGSSADFFEVHAENAMVAGGPIRRRLERLRARWPLSVHGVGLSLGGADRPDPVHLARFAEVVRWLQPRWVSEHLAWSVHGGRYHADLLPLAYDEAALRRVADHVDEVQAAIGRPLLVENPATYLQFEASTLAEAEFLAALVRRSGCGLLLDLTNAEVSAVNHAGDAAAFVRALPAASVGEIHLAGPVPDHDAAGAPLLIDSHGAPVPDSVWALYDLALARCGPVPTLIERDHAVPPLAELEAEAARARAAWAARGAPAPAAAAVAEALP